MIEVDHLVKRYGPVTAVDGLTFTVRPGHVTGFLGPNGAGKSTTHARHPRPGRPHRRPRHGRTGSRYADLARPLHQVGALLDADAVHPGRTAAATCRASAAATASAARRVDEVLRLVGPGPARRRAGSAASRSA